MEKELKREAVEQFGNEWKKYGKDRVYFNKSVYDLIGLELDYYHTGNISDAWLNGEKISNCRARRIIATLNGAYYDFNTKKFNAKNWEDGEVMELLQNKIEELA